MFGSRQIKRLERESKMLEEEWHKGYLAGAKKLEDHFQRLLDDKRKEFNAEKAEWLKEKQDLQDDAILYEDRIEQLKHTVIITRPYGMDYVRFLLNNYALWSEEGTFTFPDGETFYRDQPRGV